MHKKDVKVHTMQTFTKTAYHCRQAGKNSVVNYDDHNTGFKYKPLLKS